MILFCFWPIKKITVLCNQFNLRSNFWHFLKGSQTAKYGLDMALNRGYDHKVEQGLREQTINSESCKSFGPHRRKIGNNWLIVVVSEKSLIFLFYFSSFQNFKLNIY